MTARIRKDIMTDNTAFPHPEYKRYVLEPAFGEAQRLLFPFMMAANEAHTLMLAESGILPTEQAAALLQANRDVENAGADAFHYAPAVEDLFFAVEQQLIERAGPADGGNLQIARSRNDLDAVMARQMVREHLISLQDQVMEVRVALLDLIDKHHETLMPGVTHTQPAQPTTLAHYLLGVLGPFERDSARLASAWKRVNRCPLGVAAFTTTSFPIDRELTSRLLGFDGLIENGYDAIGASDYMIEVSGALANMAASASRFVHDLLIWSRAEANMLHIGDAFVQISSIMPQKRNPVVFEHIRARTGYVIGDAATVTTIAHSSAFGDTVDVEDPVYTPLARCCDSAAAVLGLLAAVLPTCEYDIALLAERAGQGHTTTTALADSLVKERGMSFRAAHHVVSSLVRAATRTGESINATQVSLVASDEAGREIDVDDAFVEQALDPWVMVNSRDIVGGPAPSATRSAAEQARELLKFDRAAADQRRNRLSSAIAHRRELATSRITSE
jgi:argininosuccinate lyase